MIKGVYINSAIKFQWKTPLMSFLFMFFVTSTYTQVYKGLLIEKENNGPIADALIQTNLNSDFTISDSAGLFYLQLDNNTKPVEVTISTLSCKITISINLNKETTDTIYLHCPPMALQEVTITYLSPEQIVQKAIQKISENYYDSSFVCPAFYRNYEKINGKFMHLTEARSNVLFRISPKIGHLNSNEAISVQALRKSNRLLRLDEFIGDDYKDLLMQNPIYHLFSSSLNPDKSDAFKYYLSPDTNDSVWVILFDAKKYTTENHGLENYNPYDFYGEANEQGTLIIDKSNFAFLFIERKSMRNQNYHYPKYNNFLYPDNKYTGEFIDGYLAIRFKEKDEKYYPESILHSYTNEFFATVTYQKEFRITEYFEWYAEPPLFIIPTAVMQQFETYTSIRDMKGSYQIDQWITPVPKYQLTEKEILFKDLEEKENLETQFMNNACK